MLLDYLSQKGTKHISVVNFTLQHIQDLNNHTNGTKRGFATTILEEYPKLMCGPSLNTQGEIIPFWDYDSKFTILPPYQRFC